MIIFKDIICDNWKECIRLKLNDDENDSNLFYIDRLMISKDFRNKDYANQAIQLILKEVTKNEFNLIGTSTEPENIKIQNSR